VQQDEHCTEVKTFYFALTGWNGVFPYIFLKHTMKTDSYNSFFCRGAAIRRLQTKSLGDEKERNGNKETMRRQKQV
jgi:hypothetical protein